MSSLGRPDDHLLDMTAPIDQHAHATADIVSHADQKLRQLSSDDLVRWDTAPQGPLQRLHLAMLQAMRIA